MVEVPQLFSSDPPTPSTNIKGRNQGGREREKRMERTRGGEEREN
jgi:hypothetical protein